jgi:hypothetical protein
VNFVLAVNLIVFLSLSIVWTKDSALNVCLKIVFVILAVANLVLVLHVSGYIIKVSVDGDMAELEDAHA